MITESTAYITSDGTLFTERGDAEKHEAELELTKLIEEKVPYFDGKNAVKSFLGEYGVVVLRHLQKIHN